MSPEDPRHGTTAGHYAHRKDGEPACGPCVAAKTRYEKTRHVYGPRMVPATGTRRRIQALKAMGHSGADIAAALGVTYQAVNRLEHSTSAHIFAATQANVARVYEEMCMTLPTGYHRTRIRNAAARAGYAPPLAWDDIDTDPQPVGWQYQPPSRFTRADTLAELDHLGHGITDACRRLQITRESLEKWCARHGMGEVYSRLVDREAMRYWRNGRAEGGAA